MTPNTRKPTELEPDEMIWHWYETNTYWKWSVNKAIAVCRVWEDGEAWLPYDAIPDPNKQTEGETK